MFSPSPANDGILWPQLTPVISIWYHYQTYLLAGSQASPGKNVDFPCIPVAFTRPTLDCMGLRCSLPTRPVGLASYALRVPQVAVLLPASSRPHLTMTPLP